MRREAIAMPLRDFFHEPDLRKASWEEIHGAWPGVIAFRLNKMLPAEYRSGVKVHVGAAIEVDIGAYELDDPVSNGSNGSGTAVAWAPAKPTLLLDTDVPQPPEYEVRIYDERQGRRLVAAVEIVSPGNKDREGSRDAFVSKCHALLQQDVCVVIVDPVTVPNGNLFADLAERLRAPRPKTADCSIYAVSCRRFNMRKRWRFETWPHELAVGEPLPTLPLWLTDRLHVPLELEATYEETLHGLRLA
jgi:hypothetical protein